MQRQKPLPPLWIEHRTSPLRRARTTTVL